jgi:hypothetical protein
MNTASASAKLFISVCVAPGADCGVRIATARTLWYAAFTDAVSSECRRRENCVFSVMYASVLYIDARRAAASSCECGAEWSSGAPPPCAAGGRRGGRRWRVRRAFARRWRGDRPAAHLARHRPP